MKLSFATICFLKLYKTQQIFNYVADLLVCPVSCYFIRHGRNTTTSASQSAFCTYSVDLRMVVPSRKCVSKYPDFR